MEAPLLEIRGLEIEIPVPGAVLKPVRGIDLAVRRGETLAIVGESGCGKSLTSLAIMGLLPHNARLVAERIDLAGRSLLGLSDAAWRDLRGSRMAMIFQDPMTALDPYVRPAGPRASAQLLVEGRDRLARREGSGLSAPALRRIATARSDRDGASVRAGADHR